MLPLTDETLLRVSVLMLNGATAIRNNCIHTPSVAPQALHHFERCDPDIR
jgi:hypothetical protein